MVVRNPAFCGGAKLPPFLTHRMDAASPEQRILKLEAQVNALAQAWVFLAKAVEEQCGADLATMTNGLLQRRWPSDPDINPQARDLLRFLCNELDALKSPASGQDLRDGRGSGDTDDPIES